MVKFELDNQQLLLIGGGGIAAIIAGWYIYQNILCKDGKNSLLDIFGYTQDETTGKIIKKEDEIKIPINQENLQELVEANIIDPEQAGTIYADEVYRRDQFLKDYKTFSFAAMDYVPTPRII